MLILMKRFVIENHLQILEQLMITPKQNQFKITLIRLTNCMIKEIRLCIGQQEEVESRLIGLILTQQQLSDWGCKYHELRVDKPFYDLFIEDKSLRIEEV